MTPNDNYKAILARARSQGEAKGYRHCDGWRDTKNAEVIRLYRQGKVSVALAIAHGARPKDHLAAIDSGKVNVLDIVKANVDLDKLAKVRAKQEAAKTMTPEKLARELERLKAENAAMRAENARASVTIAGQTMVSAKVEKPLTEHDKQVAFAIFQSGQRAKEKAAREAKGKAGFSPNLSDAEKRAIMATHIAKPTPKWGV